MVPVSPQHQRNTRRETNVVEDGVRDLLARLSSRCPVNRTGWTTADLPIALMEPLAGGLPPAGGAAARLLVVLRRSRYEVGVRMPRSVWATERREGGTDDGDKPGVRNGGRASGWSHYVSAFSYNHLL